MNGATTNVTTEWRFRIFSKSRFIGCQLCQFPLAVTTLEIRSVLRIDVYLSATQLSNLQVIYVTWCRRAKSSEITQQVCFLL